MSTDWCIRKKESSEGLKYTVSWSPWGAMDRWVVNRMVPSEAGIFQLWVHRKRELVPLITEMNYYGGLRNTLREVLDDMAPAGGRLREKIGGRECWFRYSTCPILDDLQNLQNWYTAAHGCTDSDENEILVQEIDNMKKFTVPPEDQLLEEKKRMSDYQYGPPMPEPGQLKS